MESHEYANLFPMMADADLKELGNDIKVHGLRDPIVTLDGKVLDGRNRHRACELVGVKPTFEVFTGEDALGFVISHNLHRRHLTESQRAMVAAKMANLDHGGRGGNLNTSIDVLKVTQPKAAEMLNISLPTVQRAKKVIASAIPEVKKMVEDGDVSVNAAYAVSKLSEDEQAAAVSGGVAGVKAAAKAAATATKEEPETVVVDGTKEEGKPGKVPPFRPDQGEDWFLHAKIQMDKIHAKDISRERVLKKMIAYCEQRLKTNK